MEIQVSVDELSRALYRAQGIVEKKSTMPILASVLLSAKKTQEGGRLTASAYDLEIGVSGTHPCEILHEGAVAIKHKELYDIVRALPAPTVVIAKQANNRVKLTCGSAEFTIVGAPAEEFPQLPQADKVSLLAIEPAVLAEMIEKTQYAISTDETRYNLTGVYCEAGTEGQGLRFVATDGHRLALSEKKLAGDFKLKRGVIIPRKGLLELRRLLGEEGAAQCQLGFTDTSCVFQRGDLQMVMRLIDATFPDYQQVIPKEAERSVSLKREGLLETLRRVSLLSIDKSSAVRCELSKGQLRLSSQNPDFGEAKEDLTVAYDGEAMKIGFNARYLIDVLGALDTEQVMLELCDELSPGVVRPVGEEKFVGVIMPMRI